MIPIRSKNNSRRGGKTANLAQRQPTRANRVPRQNVLTRAPAAQAVRGKTLPVTGVIRNGECTLEGSELFVSAVAGSTSFSATKYAVNPGMAAFAWLSDRAKGYEKYSWVEFRAEYRPSDGSTQTKGRVYMALDYDPSDPAPSSKSAMIPYESRSDNLTWVGFDLQMHRQSAFDGVQFKRVRCGPVSGDLITYDGFSLIVATDAQADTSTIGEVYLHYRIHLRSQQTEPATPISNKIWMYNLSASQSLTTNVADIVEYDEVIVDGLELGAPTAGVLTLPCGTFKVTATGTVYSTAATSFSASWKIYKNGTLLPSPVISTAYLTQSSAQCGIAMFAMAYVTSDGNDTISVEATVSAGGTLTVIGDTAKLTVEVI